MCQLSLFAFEQDFLNQNSDISTTTLFTPAADGNYIGTITTIPAGTTIDINWTDSGSNSRTRSTTNDLVFAFRAKSGQPVTIDSSGSTGTYSVWVTFQQLINS